MSRLRSPLDHQSPLYYGEIAEGSHRQVKDFLDGLHDQLLRRRVHAHDGLDVLLLVLAVHGAAEDQLKLEKFQ